MGFIKGLKRRSRALCVFAGVFLLGVISCVPSIHAQEKGSVENSSPVVQNDPPSSTSATADPNAVKNEVNSEIVDPNSVTKNNSEEIDDPNDLATADLNIISSKTVDPNTVLTGKSEGINEDDEKAVDTNAITRNIVKDKAGSKEADPNTVSVDKSEEIVDPNDQVGEDDEGDDFVPSFSQYNNINRLYKDILNPELVTDKGMVDYGTLRRKRQDIVRAASELDELNPAILMALSQNDKKALEAFWINTYNFCMLKLVVDHYPIEPKLYMIFYPDNSIMQISGNWRTKYFFDIQGLEYNLQEIEENFLLDRFGDPRIIFALSYASVGGAPLRDEPYTAEKLDQQLNDQVKEYLQSPEGMRIDRENNVLYLSNLFTMHNHRQVFLDSKYAEIKKFRNRPPDEQAWLNFIWQYVSEKDQRYLETATFDIRFMKYNWQLNETH